MEVINVSDTLATTTNDRESSNADTTKNNALATKESTNEGEEPSTTDKENESGSSVEKDDFDEKPDDSNPQAPTGGHRRGRRSGGSRGGRGRRQTNRKGSWKKLDVEVRFGRNGNSNGPHKRGEKDNMNKDEASNSHLDGQDGTASSSSSSKGNSRRRNNSNRHRGSGRHKDEDSLGNNWRDQRTPGKRSNRGRNQKSRQQGYGATIYAPQNGEGLEIVKKHAVGQIEYFFSADELCKNTFLRNHMDTEGYLPAAIVFNFPSVVKYSIPYGVLLEAVAESENLEVDSTNETIRIKGDYKKWLFPNNEGGFGCPRWIKQAPVAPEDLGDVHLEQGELEAKSEIRPSDVNGALSTEKSKIGMDDSNPAPDVVGTDGEGED